MRVLVVDDEPNIVRLVQIHLTRHGFEVETAGDGAEALIKAQANPPAVLVSDVFMPNMNGFELVKTLHADPRFGALKIVIMTATPNDRPLDKLEISCAETVAKWGINCFIAKPFNPTMLVQIVPICPSRSRWIRLYTTNCPIIQRICTPPLLVQRTIGL